MNVDGPEPEPEFPSTQFDATTSSAASAASGSEENVLKRKRKSRSPEAQQYVIAQGFTDPTSRLQRSVVEPVVYQAVHVFLSDTVHPTLGRLTSKGHFAKLVALVQSSSDSEALPSALEAVALASLANRFCNAEARLQATRRYITSICRLRQTNLSSKSDVLSVIACILLLGLYEIINANATDEQNWIRHLNGIIAVMKNSVQREHLPASGILMLVLGTEPLPPTFNPSRQPSPSSSSSAVAQPIISKFNHLCTILPKVQKLFKHSAPVLEPLSIRYESTLQRHREEAVALKSELLAWSTEQPDTTRPETIERFTQPYVLRFQGVEDLTCPITRADTYRDYFIACMWNTYRQCQLHLTDLLDRINRSLNKNPEAYNNSREHTNLCSEIQALIDAICASIPFLLAGESIYGTKPRGSIWLQACPPMLLGGLHLQWVIFTISILEIVPEDVRTSMKALLAWVGKNLGIRQATVLSQMDKNLPGGITAKGDALRWVGFLI